MQLLESNCIPTRKRLLIRHQPQVDLAGVIGNDRFGGVAGDFGFAERTGAAAQRADTGRPRPGGVFVHAVGIVNNQQHVGFCRGGDEQGNRAKIK